MAGIKIPIIWGDLAAEAISGVKRRQKAQRDDIMHMILNSIALILRIHARRRNARKIKLSRFYNPQIPEPTSDVFGYKAIGAPSLIFTVICPDPALILAHEITSINTSPAVYVVP